MKAGATVKRFLEENMGYGSIINKLNSFMENIEDPEQTKQNLKDFNLGFNAMPANQLAGETLKFKKISVTSKSQECLEHLKPAKEMVWIFLTNGQIMITNNCVLKFCNKIYIF